ncbi:30S ribosome-binding factor RbfA [Bacteroidota bacterium]
MATTRQNKVSKLIQKDLASIFQLQIKSIYPSGMITVTVVRVTPDLALAKVYLSIFPSNKSNEILEHVQRNVRYFRHQLAQKLKNQLKKMPELDFYLDDSLDYIENIENLLKK